LLLLKAFVLLNRIIRLRARVKDADSSGLSHNLPGPSPEAAIGEMQRDFLVDRI
jgi:hypothetical protein